MPSVTIFKRFHNAAFRATSWLRCLQSPRPARLRGWKRWAWLARQCRDGRVIDPTVQFWCRWLLDDHLFLETGSFLDRGAIIWIDAAASSKGTVRLGKNVYIGPYAFLGSCHRLEIGDDAMIGAHSYITTANHVTQRRDIPYGIQGYVGGDVRIGRNVWIGCNVVVLPNVTIGDHAIIGAGAVVNKDVPAGEVWGGVPAKRLHSHKSNTGHP